MALQGALETFQLDDVLRLLGSSEKTGLLTLTGDRGVGRVWVIDGQIVQTEIEVDTNFVENDADAVFHMLRFASGDYVFEADEQPSEPTEEALSMETVLAEAATRLDEWTDIVGVVEGLETWVGLSPTIDDEVTIDAATWERLARIGSGVTIREMGVQLAEAELSTMRAVKELVERGLADVGDAPALLASAMPVIEQPDPVEYVSPVTDAVIESDPGSHAPIESTTTDEVIASESLGQFDIGAEDDAYGAVAQTGIEADGAGYAPVADAGIAATGHAPVTAGIESDPTAYEPSSEVPASWQTAAPASAWPSGETPDYAEPSAYGESPVSAEPPAYGESPVSAEPPAYGETPNLAESPAYGESPVAAEPSAYGEPASHAEQPASDLAVGSVEPQDWQAPAGADGAEAWNAEPLAGESTWAASDEGWPADVSTVAHEWDAPATGAGVAPEPDQWPAPPPPPGEANTGVDPAIESLYDQDHDFDGYADADTGAIEYGDGAFDQAAEALGWSHEVDNSPEGFWGEAPGEAEPVARMAADEASEMARRLAELSPAAARAVAQAARATTPEEREAALAEAEAEDASVDRSLLLRFLGSFDS